MEHRMPPSAPTLGHTAEPLRAPSGMGTWVPCTARSTLGSSTSLGTLEEKKRGFPLGSDSSHLWGTSVSLASPVLSSGRGPGRGLHPCVGGHSVSSPLASSCPECFLSPFWSMGALRVQRVFSWWWVYLCTCTLSLSEGPRLLIDT